MSVSPNRLIASSLAMVKSRAQCIITLSLTWCAFGETWAQKFQPSANWLEAIYIVALVLAIKCTYHIGSAAFKYLRIAAYMLFVPRRALACSKLTCGSDF